MQIICPLTFVIGIVLTLYCIHLGSNHAHIILKEHGGSMDTGTFIIYLQESIRTYRELGISLIIISALCEIGLMNRIHN